MKGRGKRSEQKGKTGGDEKGQKRKGKEDEPPLNSHFWLRHCSWAAHDAKSAITAIDMGGRADRWTDCGDHSREIDSSWCLTSQLVGQSASPSPGGATFKISPPRVKTFVLQRLLDRYRCCCKQQIYAYINHNHVVLFLLIRIRLLFIVIAQCVRIPCTCQIK